MRISTKIYLSQNALHDQLVNEQTLKMFYLKEKWDLMMTFLSIMLSSWKQLILFWLQTHVSSLENLHLWTW
jgi:hypothetical protein